MKLRCNDPEQVQAEREWRRQLAQMRKDSVSRRLLDQEHFPGRRIAAGFRMRGFEDWPPRGRRRVHKGVRL